MPSALVKVEKEQSSNANSAEIVADNNTPIRQVLTSIEHKIRNLEKRKLKLESYRDTEKSGKELSNDQKVAVSKYNEVTQTLEFAREFSKQIGQINNVYEKELKKKQKKDETTKRQNEIFKIREVLIIQDILNSLTDNEIREDFLNGTNGACKLENSELEILDKFHSEVTPKRSNAPDVSFKTAAQKSAKQLLSLVDGKDIADSHCNNVKTILKNIQKSGYFDKTTQPPVTQEGETPELTNDLNDAEVQPLEQDNAVETEIVLQKFHEAPPAVNVPAPAFPLVPPQPAQLVQPVPTIVQPIPVMGISRVPPPTVAIPPTSQMHQHLAPTAHAVEQAMFKHQYIQQQMRPISEILGSANYLFLQESEVEPQTDVAATNFHQQQITNSQVSPNQPVSQQLPTQPPTISQPSQQQISPATQLPTQTFNNPSFVPSPMYTVKQTDAPQNHIPGFVSGSVPVPIPLVQSAVVPNHQQTQQSTQINTNSNQIHANNVSSSVPITSFPPTGKFIASNLSTQTGLPKEKRHHTKDMKQIENEPEINEWKPEDATKPPEETPFGHFDGDWNDADDSTWSNNQRQYQYRSDRNNSGGNGTGSRERNRGSRLSGGNGTNGYRKNNSYQMNGRQTGNGGGERGNTFYRNNDNFYSNGGNYKQDRNDRGDNKQDGGYRGGNFGSRNQTNGSMRNGGGPRNAQRYNDSSDRERGSNRNSTHTPRSMNKGGNSFGNPQRGPTSNTGPTANIGC